MRLLRVRDTAMMWEGCGGVCGGGGGGGGGSGGCTWNGGRGAGSGFLEG